MQVPSSENDRVLWISNKKAQLKKLGDKMVELVHLRNKYCPAKHRINRVKTELRYPFAGAKSLFKQNTDSMNKTTKKINDLVAEFEYLEKLRVDK